MTRTRPVATPASNGGNQCPGSATDTRTCNPNACPGSKIIKAIANIIEIIARAFEKSNTDIL